MARHKHRPDPDQPVLMDHEYDGIREYDQRLPNWWLATLFGTVLFSLGYWFYYFQSDVGKDDRTVVNAEIARIEAQRLAAIKDLDDATLLKMSANPAMVAAGEATFKNTCAACHGPNGEGINGIGFRLNDNLWVHGHTPKAVFDNIANGIRFEGKPTGMAAQSQLGAGKIAEVVAYLYAGRSPAEMKAIPRADEPTKK